MTNYRFLLFTPPPPLILSGLVGTKKISVRHWVDKKMASLQPGYNPWDFVEDGKWFLPSAKDVEAPAES